MAAAMVVAETEVAQAAALPTTAEMAAAMVVVETKVA